MSNVNDVLIKEFDYVLQASGHGDMYCVGPENVDSLRIPSLLLGAANSAGLDEKIDDIDFEYYKNLAPLVPLTPEAHTILREKFSIPIPVTEDWNEAHRWLTENWPEITKDKFYELKTSLNIEFLSPVKLIDNPGRYALMVNKNFWMSIKWKDLFGAVIEGTCYEGSFKKEELFFNDYETAMKYGVVMTDRLLCQMWPDARYYFDQHIDAEIERALLESLKPIGMFYGFEYNKYSGESIPEKYQEAFLKYPEWLSWYMAAYQNIKEPPFFLVQSRSKNA